MDCEKLLSEIKELHESIELKQAELEALQKAETPDDAAIDGVNGLIDDWQQAIASSIEIWDTYCDTTILEEEMQRLIWLYAPKPEEPQAEEGEGSSMPEEEQPEDASLAPDGSTLLLVDDVALDYQRLCEEDGLHIPRMVSRQSSYHPLGRPGLWLGSQTCASTFKRNEE